MQVREVSILHLLGLLYNELSFIIVSSYINVRVAIRVYLRDARDRGEPPHYCQSCNSRIPTRCEEVYQYKNVCCNSCIPTRCEEVYQYKNVCCNSCIPTRCEKMTEYPAKVAIRVYLRDARGCASPNFVKGSQFAYTYEMREEIIYK